ncbi:MAG: HPr(Ser) kinase/phosphatase [Oscillospiraceae bacterium]|nr:HPr(Ser) kinase/phosphatase [Oscillospiraceae bacterium]
MENLFQVRLTDIIREFNLSIAYAPENLDEIIVVSDNVNRPGLQLAGFFDYFDASRIQVMGKVEMTFISRFKPEQRYKALEKLMSKHIPCVIVSGGYAPYPELLTLAEKYRIPLLRTNDTTSRLISALIASLNIALAPRITRHGVLVEVYGEGILLLGESGVGKSETALELVKRGHRLIADDAVEIKKVSAKTLVGSAPELIRHYIELRGIGVVDVRRIFGMGAVKPTEKVDLVINIEPWQDNSAYDRLGLDDQFIDILDVRIPLLVVPVKPGRNLAVIIEVAAMNNRHKKLGYNAAQDFASRINSYFEKITEENKDN